MQTDDTNARTTTNVSRRAAGTHGPITRGLLIGTLAVAAYGAATVDRALVGAPAWNHLGPAAWAAYSRYADNGNGLVVYPIYGIGLTVLAIATAVSYRLDRGAPRPAGPPIYLAALCALGVIATTIRAAPIMLHVGQIGARNPTALQYAYDQFTFWGIYVRGALGALALLASIWALAVYPRARHAQQR